MLGVTHQTLPVTEEVIIGRLAWTGARARQIAGCASGARCGMSEMVGGTNTVGRTGGDRGIEMRREIGSFQWQVHAVLGADALSLFPPPPSALHFAFS